MGRHREFDLDQTLDAALNVFWSNGFEGTSYADLCDATGVARAGLYAAFGNKVDLFYLVLDRYIKRHLGFMSEALRQPTSLEVASMILFGEANAATGTNTPKGCLIINGAMAASVESEPVRIELARRREWMRQALVRRMRLAKQEGDLPTDADPTALGTLLLSMGQGIAVQAQGGLSRAELRRVASAALELWPKPEKRKRRVTAITPLPNAKLSARWPTRESKIIRKASAS